MSTFPNMRSFNAEVMYAAVWTQNLRQKCFTKGNNINNATYVTHLLCITTN